MRIVFMTLMVAIALPAAAQAAPPQASDRTDAAVAALQSPIVQDGLARTITQLAGIVMDTRVGGLAVLTDPAEDVRPNDTLGDVVRRRDPEADTHLYEKTRRSIATAGAVAGGVAGQVAAIDRTAARLQAALAPLLAMLGSNDNAPDGR